MKLAIITTHPIQYNAPLFALLAQRAIIEIKVFYTWGEEVLQQKFDPGFGKVIEWDIPLLQGYPYCFVNNTAKEKGSHHFRGIVNPGLNKVIENWGANAILVYGWSFVSHLAAMRYFKGKIPVLFRGDSTLLDKQNLIKTLVRNITLQSVYNNIDYAFYAGVHNYNYFKRYGLKEKQLFYAPHCIDNDRFSAISKKSKEVVKWREGLGIPLSCMVLLFVGKLEPKKNPLILFEIMKHISSPQLHLVIVGDGMLSHTINELSKQDHRIHCLGFQNQGAMPLIYAGSNIFILPSNGPGETWGLAINEAMAAGCAIIASSKVGGAVDLVEATKNGLIFSNDIQDVVSYIKQLMASSDLVLNAGNYSKNKIKEFSFLRTAQAIETLSQSLMDQN